MKKLENIRRENKNNYLNKMNEIKIENEKRKKLFQMKLLEEKKKGKKTNEEIEREIRYLDQLIKEKEDEANKNIARMKNENEKKLKEIEEQYQKEIKKLDEENKYKLEQLEQQYKLIMDNNKRAIERDIQNYIVNLRNIN